MEKLGICFLPHPSLVKGGPQESSLTSTYFQTVSCGGAGQSAPAERLSDLMLEVESSKCAWEMPTRGKLRGSWSRELISSTSYGNHLLNSFDTRLPVCSLFIQLLTTVSCDQPLPQAFHYLQNG